MSGEDLILARLEAIEAKLDRVAALEQRLEEFARPWDSLADLGRDAGLLVGPAAKLLTEELAEVETGFQLEDVLALLKRLLLSFRHLSWALEQLENLIDWWQDLEPLLRVAVPHLIDKLDELEEQGIFRINKAMLGMYAKLAATYTAEDIDAIGDGFVRMHGLIKKLAEPEMIDFLEAFSNLPAHIKLDQVKPISPLKLMSAMLTQDARRGLGVAVEMTKALGRLPEDAKSS